ncbi:hypothetical protein BDB01DRAFT_716279 [Pilobolus umbonatus]|nr:hypothetical protein BDB01DRAFT_716279 [Pilobolus umbonatus]
MIEDSYIDLVSESLFDIPKKKHHLFFYSPFLRGQTITFSLQNLFPEDNIIVFKFLTSNSNHAFHTNRYYNGKQPAERYFVQPSAGRLTMEQSTDILLFLNQAPIMNPDEVLKDKIVIKWAVIQKNTEIEAWVNSLQDSTRRKWIDMLEDEWSDQVTLRMTSIKIRFIS